MRIFDRKRNQAAEAYMSFWTKEREPGVWDFKGKAGNPQGDEKEQMSGKPVIASHPETTESNKQTLLDSSLSATRLVHILMLKW